MLLAAAERLQYQGYLRREQTNVVIMEFAKDGATIKEIVRRTGHSSGLVRQVLGYNARRLSDERKFV